MLGSRAFMGDYLGCNYKSGYGRFIINQVGINESVIFLPRVKFYFPNLVVLPKITSNFHCYENLNLYHCRSISGEKITITKGIYYSN